MRDVPEPFHCPTCGARQAPAAECRRCKCDLRLVVAVRQQVDAAQQACLTHVRKGEGRQALRWALRRMRLSSDDTARQLLTAMLLRAGRYQAALDVGDASATSPDLDR
jgi:hypothetical protein